MPQGSIKGWLKKHRTHSGDVVDERHETRESEAEKNKNTLMGSVADKTYPPLTLPRLPSNVDIVPWTYEHEASLRRLNTVLFPIPYPHSFYKESFENSIIGSISRIALWSSSQPGEHTATPPAQVAAAIRCRLTDTHTPGGATLYISTIGVLAPYRQHALASHLLASVTATAIHKYHVTRIMAHVWEDNADALEWYKKRGFEIVAKEDNYYARLAPKTAAFVIERPVKPSDLIIAKNQDNA